jgi:hypothetical protein
MCERALPVATYESHTGFGRAWGSVTISTRLPLRSTVPSGTGEPSTFAAMQWLPTSVCTA